MIRDLGWYVFGADYLTPDFCEGLSEDSENGMGIMKGASSPNSCTRTRCLPSNMTTN